MGRKPQRFDSVLCSTVLVPAEFIADLLVLNPRKRRWGIGKEKIETAPGNGQRDRPRCLRSSVRLSSPLSASKSWTAIRAVTAEAPHRQWQSSLFTYG